MKKVLSTIAAVLMLGSSVFAQDKFFPGWQLGIRGGAGITVGETEKVMQNLVSPAADIFVGYQFTPVFTLRADLGGWQGKGVTSTANGLVDYKFNYLQGAADAVFDFCNIAGYKERVVNPYGFFGIGGMLCFNNKAPKDLLPPVNKYWEGKALNILLRVGLGVDFRISDNFGLMLELVENATDDAFNSKSGDTFDHQINALAGIRFKFGQKSKKAAYQAALAAEAAAAAQAAAEAKAAEEARIAAEAAAAQAAAEAAAAKAAEEAAAAAKVAEQAAKAASLEAGTAVYFNLGKSDVTAEEMGTINYIADFMKENPAVKVNVCGYADKSTGSAKFNMALSQKRAEAVAAAIENAGIAKDRISINWKGDKEQVSEIAEKNRVVVVFSE